MRRNRQERKIHEKLMKNREIDGNNDVHASTEMSVPHLHKLEKTVIQEKREIDSGNQPLKNAIQRNKETPFEKK